jgi:hypothetical protein
MSSTNRCTMPHLSHNTCHPGDATSLCRDPCVQNHCTTWSYQHNTTAGTTGPHLQHEAPDLLIALQLVALKIPATVGHGKHRIQLVIRQATNGIILRLVALVPGLPGLDEGGRVGPTAHPHPVRLHKCVCVAGVQGSCKHRQRQMPWERVVQQQMRNRSYY